MPPKKKEAKAANGEVVEGEDPIVFLKNYTSFCKAAGLTPNPSVGKTLNDEEKYPIEQLVIDDEYGALGPGGTRALCTALMGHGPGMKGGPYKLLMALRLWKANIGDDGAASIAEVLRLGGAEVKLSYVELFDDNIGPRGALALGIALSKGNNLSLLNLKLDFNPLGPQGMANLARGLRTNGTLKQLHVRYCGITTEGGPYVSEVLANARTALEVLNLEGNRLGGAGLAVICSGLMVNTVLQTLVLNDNMIDQSSDDLNGLAALRDCLLNPSSGLTAIELLCNRIGEAGASIMIPALTPENKKVTVFTVDVTVPMNIFEQIFRKGGGKKGKKGKKGKGKKK